MSSVDEGLPIAYEVLEKGVPVIGSDGELVGTVDHVVAAPEQDIFHGLVIATAGSGRRFVEAANVEALHERGVDLRIDSSAVASLPKPGGAAPSFTDDPASSTWSHWVRRLTLRKDWRRES